MYHFTNQQITTLCFCCTVINSNNELTHIDFNHAKSHNMFIEEEAVHQHWRESQQVKEKMLTEEDYWQATYGMLQMLVSVNDTGEASW